MTTTAHHFSTTGEAYDACQCDPAVKDGDTLIVSGERVVGVAHTWPFAVSAQFGELHTVAAGVADEKLANDFSIPVEAIQQARSTAASLGF